MSNKFEETESVIDALKCESARQRWQLFHRAIAFAKQSNNASLESSDSSSVEQETQSSEPRASGPILSVIR